MKPYLIALAIPAVFLICICLTAPAAWAQVPPATDGCATCANDTEDMSYCNYVYDGEWGYSDCTGGWNDCHEGTAGQCASHCHVAANDDGSPMRCSGPCVAGYVLDDDGNCVNECPEGYYASGGTCYLNTVCDEGEYWTPTGCKPYQIAEGPDDEGSIPGGHTPLLIKLTAGPWRFSGGDDPVEFDYYADGSKERTTWTDRGAEIAFLALDRDGSGAIENGYELFGGYAPKEQDRAAANGFKWLREYDLDRSGTINQYDPIWHYLLLWVDRNHDAVSQADELSKLADSGITELGLRYVHTGRRDPGGTQLRLKGQLWRGPRVESWYDVTFAKVWTGR